MGRSSWPPEPSPPAGARPTFQRLFDTYFKSIERLVQWLGVARRNAPDVAQDVFFAVHRALPKLDPERPVQPWLRAIACRIARDHLRLHHHRREEFLEAGADLDEAELADPAWDAAEQRVAMEDAAAIVSELVQNLDEKRREVFLLHDIHQMSLEDIAIALKLPETTVQSWLRRARKDFEAALRRYCAADEHKLSRARLLPLLDPVALLAACRMLPDAFPELAVRVSRRVAQASADGVARTSGVVLTSAQIASGLAAALLGGAIAGGAAVYAWRKEPRVAPEAAIHAEPPLPVALVPVPAPAPVSPPVDSASMHAVSPPSTAAAPRAAVAAPGQALGPSTLNAELLIIDRARTALEQGRLDVALENVNRHGQQFPDGVLASEREELRRAIEDMRRAAAP